MLFLLVEPRGKILIKTFQLEQIELFQAKYTDLRDIHVLSDSSILVMGIASPGHIWKIKKGEKDGVKSIPIWILWFLWMAWIFGTTRLVSFMVTH